MGYEDPRRVKLNCYLVAVGNVRAALPTTFSTPGVTVVLARGGCNCTVNKIWAVAEYIKSTLAAALFARC